jgi:4-hydroxybutyryl-CoA dehydratase/vinylacetyl-CoA-Delta-isomerase
VLLRTKDQFIKSLRDGRNVYFKGEKVDVTAHAFFDPVINHLGIEFDIPESPQYRDLVTFSPNGEDRYSKYFKIPQDSQDLLERNRIIDLGTRLGGTVVLLIKEIGTDCLFALNIISKQMDAKLQTEYFKRVSNYHDYCMKNDLAMAVAQTDVKGDRSLGPSDQEHEDYYVRIVEEKSDGIVVRGAKAHTSYGPCVNELMVIPTRNLSDKDRQYAVAFAVPANAKGVKMIASPFGGTTRSEFHNPISSSHHMVESLTIFDDVFVPWERVFMKGETQFAGALALTFVQYHRFTAISYKAPILDLLVGAAILMAQINGISDASHVREKISRLIAYSETVKGLTRQSALNCRKVEGIAVPDPVYSNIAKWHFASNYHQNVALVQDLTGGLTVTGPSEEDVNSPVTGEYVRKYLAARRGISAEDRLRVINLIRDLTASDFGGYNELLQIHAEGSIEASKITLLREYDARPCIELAQKLAKVKASSF